MGYESRIFLQIFFNVADCKIKLEKINVALIVKLIEIKTKNNTAHNFGRVSGVINTLITATVFSTVYIRIELLLGSFCIFIIPKTKRIANFANPSDNVPNNIDSNFVEW